MIYDFFMWPLEKMALAQIRRNLIPLASGEVLEIGFATGVNTKYYPESIHVTALDLEIHSKIESRYSNIKFVEGDGHHLPFENHQFDTVISTLTLCSVKDIAMVISEIHRVLKPNGRYLFIEHILPKTKNKKRIFNWFNPHWYKISKSCQINHQTDKIMENSQFVKVDHNYSNSTIFYYGVATK